MNFNDTVLAYDLEHANLSGLDEYKEENRYVPEVVIVKKTFPKLRKRQKNRYWKLKHFEKKEEDEENNEDEDMNMDEEDEDGNRVKAPKQQKKSKKNSKKKGRILEKADFKNDKDYELFLRDLEEDPELRANVNLYKVSNNKNLS